MKFLKEHFFAIFALFVLLIIIAASGVAVYLLFYSENSDPYNTRLTGIEKYPIETKKVNDTKEKLMETGKVSKVDYVLEGRLINFDIYVNKDTPLNDAKEVANSILANFSEEQLAYYDLHVCLINEEEAKEVAEKNKDLEENSEARVSAVYPVFGTKHKTSEGIHFTK